MRIVVFVHNPHGAWFHRRRARNRVNGDDRRAAGGANRRVRARDTDGTLDRGNFDLDSGRDSKWGQ